MSTVILTGGGTAGHCSPCLCLLPYLKNDFDRIAYIGSENGIEKNIVSKTDIPYYHVSCAKLTRKFTLSNLKIPFSVIKGVKEAGAILDKEKPNVVFSKGGYVSVPTVIAAYKRKIPVISHESDITMGLANKFTSIFCKKVLTAFPETAKTVKNGVYVGSPVKSKTPTLSKLKIFEKYGFNVNKPVLLIIGGSLGATAINKAVKGSLNELLSKYNIIHVCGKGNLINVKKAGYYQTEFIPDIENAYSITDVAVSRAGANSLFEILSMKIPALVIPLPKGTSRGDQILNAEYFQKAGYISVLNQKALSSKSLVFAINSLYENKILIEKNLEKNPVKDQSKKIADIIYSEAKIFDV